MVLETTSEQGDRFGVVTRVAKQLGIGVQYLAIRYTERLADEAAVTSVGSRGDSYDCETLLASRAA